MEQLHRVVRLDKSRADAVSDLFFPSTPRLDRSRKGIAILERAGRRGPALDEGGCPTGQVPEYTLAGSRPTLNQAWMRNGLEAHESRWLMS
jgi:hypothetical protein